MKTESKDTAARERLDVLVGKWTIEMAAADGTRWPGGWTTFEWLPDAPLLLQRTHLEHPEAPDGISIIGCDGTSGTYSMLYTDERDVQRIYEMRFGDNDWILLRLGEPFSQRYMGKLSLDGKTITGRWERSDDGARWTLDLNCNFVKVG